MISEAAPQEKKPQAVIRKQEHDGQKPRVSSPRKADSVSPGQISFMDTDDNAKSGPAKQSLSDNDIASVLIHAGFKCIDHRNKSSILWVIYQREKKDIFDAFVERYKLNAALEKRGSLATGGQPAWRIQMK